MLAITKIFLFITAILLVCCQKPSSSPTYYELSETESNAEIEILEGTDTIYVWGSKAFVYRHNFAEQIIDSLKVFVDENKIYSIINTSYIIGLSNGTSIDFKSKNYDDGWYKLNYITYSHIAPNSGSRLYHYFADTTSVIMNIDNSPPEQVKIIDSQIVDGKLQISWKKYLRGNFQSYEIIKNYNFNKKITITNRNVSFWSDPEYVGGDCNYRINIKAADQEVEGLINEFSYSLSIVVAETNKTDGIQVSWTKCLFDSSFNKYNLMRSFGSRNDWENILELDKIRDTSYFDPTFLFGDKIHYRVDVDSPENTTIGNSNFSYFGTAIPSFQDLKFSPSQNLIYLLNSASMDPTTHIINAENMSIERVNNAVVPILSNDCSKAYYISEPANLISLDPITYEQIEEYKLPEFTGRELAHIDEVSAANNGRVIFRGFTQRQPTYYFDRYYLFDLVNGEVLATMGNYKTISAVSNDLNHFVQSEGLYKYTVQYAISGTGVVLKDDQYCFYPKNNNFITTHLNKITITELSNYTVLKQIEIEEPLYHLALDETDDYLGGFTSDVYSKKFKIYNLITGELVLNSEVIPSLFWLVNGNIFSRAGYYIPIRLMNNIK